MLTFSFLDGLAPQPGSFSSVNFGSYQVRDANNQEIGRIEWTVEQVVAVPDPLPVPLPGVAPLAFAGLAATGTRALRQS